MVLGCCGVALVCVCLWVITGLWFTFDFGVGLVINCLCCLVVTVELVCFECLLELCLVLSVRLLIVVVVCLLVFCVILLRVLIYCLLDCVVLMVLLRCGLSFSYCGLMFDCCFVLCFVGSCD